MLNTTPHLTTPAEHLECDLCHEPILPGEKYSDDGSEVAHTSCVTSWFSRNYGRETL